MTKTRVLLVWATAVVTATAAPQPGDVYREYYVAMGGAKDWRVTDPEPEAEGAREFLPNSVLRLEIDDLKGARRAEVQIDRWGGHPCTKDKRIRFNGSAWLDLPELATTPSGAAPSCFMSQDNPIIEVPLAHLREGRNTLEGTAGNQGDRPRGWGQWGWYGAVIRVFYDTARATATGRISSPRAGDVMEDNQSIRVAVDGPADRVDVLAWYDGIDENGDGIFEDWHHAYRSVELTGHAGTAMAAPWTIRWDTRWVPDQRPRAVKLMARVRDRNGMWFVTPVVDGLALARRGHSVRLYKPEEAPPQYWVRADRRRSSKARIPAEDGLDTATEAVAALATWNGYQERFRVNGEAVEIRGRDHNYEFALRPVPVKALRTGHNEFAFHSTTEHHGVEILWPGPTLLVRYGSPPGPAAARTDWLNPEYAVRFPLEVESDVATDLAVEVDLSLPSEANLGALRVVQYHDAAPEQVRDTAVPWQYDGTADRGTLVFQPRGGLRAGGKRRFHLYVATGNAPRLVFEPHARLQGMVEHEGQASYRVTSASATYVYHAEGAGFASLYDADGNDWVGYHPGNRSAGEFRGIPNLGDWGHPGYTGKKGSRTVVESEGPLRVRLRSESPNGDWAARWDFFADHARMTVLKAARPYWFLYEGTPGGKLDLGSDYWVTSHGTRRSIAEHWHGDLPDPEWLYFGDGKAKRVLFLANHQSDPGADQFWPMEGNMTVFGFGRQYRCCERYLTAVPGYYSIGLVDDNDHETVAARVRSAMANIKVTVGRPERR